MGDVSGSQRCLSPVHPQYQKYLCFQVGDLKFRYLVLPFGLMSALGV